MKKSLFFVILIVILSSLYLFTGCSGGSFGSSTDTLTEKQNKNTTISIDVDGSINSFPVTYGSLANVTSFTKPGFYLKGIYDKKEGGVKYFNSDGGSTSVWQNTYPKTLFAQWGDLNELSKTLKTKFADEAYYYTRKVNCIWSLPGDFRNAVHGNLDKEIEVTLEFRLKEGNSTIFDTNNQTNWITLKDSTDGSAENFGEKTFSSYTSNYTSYSCTWVVPARCARNGSIIIEFNRGNQFNETYIRDAVVSVQFKD